jgi:thiol-disulfide isomerase/thioredoxin
MLRRILLISIVSLSMAALASGGLTEYFGSLKAKEEDKPIFLYFYSETCPICKIQKPMIDDLEREYGDKLNFIRVNGPKDEEMVERFNVTGYPTVFLIAGDRKRKFSGLTGAEELENGILSALNGEGINPSQGGHDVLPSDSDDFRLLKVTSGEIEVILCAFGGTWGRTAQNYYRYDLFRLSSEPEKWGLIVENRSILVGGWKPIAGAVYTSGSLEGTYVYDPEKSEWGKQTYGWAGVEELLGRSATVTGYSGYKLKILLGPESVNYPYLRVSVFSSVDSDCKIRTSAGINEEFSCLPGESIDLYAYYAALDKQYEFERWSGDLPPDADPYKDEITVVMDRDRTITVHFKPNVPTLTLSAHPQNPGYNQVYAVEDGSPATDVKIIAIKLSVDELADWVISTVTFHTSGCGNEKEDVKKAKLYLGKVGGDLLGEKTFSEDDGDITFTVARILNAGESISLFLTYDLDETKALPCSTYSASISAADVNADPLLEEEYYKTPPDKISGGPTEIKVGELVILSGDEQWGPEGKPLPNPFKVKIKNQHPETVQHIEFTLSKEAEKFGARFSNGGTVSKVEIKADGTAEETLILGEKIGKDNPYHAYAALITQKREGCSCGLYTIPVKFTAWGAGMEIAAKHDGTGPGDNVAKMFITGIEANNEFIVKIEPIPGIEVKKVTFQLKDETKEGEVLKPNELYKAEFDMGVVEGSEKLKVVAEMKDGSKFEKEMTIQAIPPPSWFDTVSKIATGFTKEFDDEDGIYRFNFHYPSDFVWKDYIPGDIGLLGGLDFNLPIEFDAWAEFHVNQKSGFGAGMSKSIEFLGKEITLEGSMKGVFDQRFEFDHGKGELRASTSFDLPEKGYSKTFLIYGVPVTAAIDLGGNVEVYVNGEVVLNSKLAFQEGTITPGTTITGTITISLSVVYGLAKIAASGEPSVTLEIEISYSTEEGTDATWRGEVVVPIKVVGSLFWGLASAELFSTELGPWKFGPGASEGYPVIIASSPAPGGNVPDLISSSAVAVDTIGREMVVWIADTDPTPDSPNPDVYYRYFDGTSWSDAAPIIGPASPNQLWEIDPAVVFLEEGRALAAWTSNDGDKGLNNLNDIFAHQDILYSIWNGDGWTSPKPIVDDNEGDGAVSLVYDRISKKAFAVWVHDRNSDRDVNTRGEWEIWYSVYDPAKDVWSQPQAIPSTVDESADFDPVVGADGRGGVYVIWVKDVDGKYYQELDEVVDGSNVDYTNKDCNVYQVVWTGDGWSAPTVLSSANSETEQMLSLSFGGGRGIAVWVGKDGTKDKLYWSTFNGGSWSAPGIVTESDYFIEDPKVAVDGLGNAVVVWRGYDGYDGDIFFSELKGTRWSDPKQVTEDDLTDWDLSVSVGGGKVSASWTKNDLKSKMDHASPGFSDGVNHKVVKVAEDADVVVLINEVHPAEDWIELFNPGNRDVNLKGWKLMDGDGGFNLLIPPNAPDWDGVLEGGAYLVIHLASGDTVNTPSEDIYVGIGDVLSELGDSVSLLNPYGKGVDFVRYGNSTAVPPLGTGWRGDNPTSPEAAQSLGRGKESTDTDSGADWESTCGVDVNIPTPGTRNEDIIPPAKVTDLKAAVSEGTIILTWTAPGDDGTSGTAKAYDIRYHVSQISEFNWGFAAKIENIPVPKPAGGSEKVEVKDLSPGITYHFALRTVDGFGNWSGLSNVISVTLPQGRPSINVGLHFDGVDDYVEIPDSPSLDITGPFTIEAWYKPETLGGQYKWQRIVAKPHTSCSSPYAMYSIEHSPYNNITFKLADSNYNEVTIWSDTRIQNGRWYHVVGVYDGDRQRIYVNGVEEKSVPRQITVGTNDRPLFIGAAPGGCDEYFGGVISEVRIWNRALDEETIRKWMHRRVTDEHPYRDSLVGYWRLNEGSGETIHDLSGKGNHGTLKNMNLAEAWVTVSPPMGDKAHIGTGKDDLAENDDVPVDINWIDDPGDGAVFAAMQVDSYPAGVRNLPGSIPPLYWKLWIWGDDGGFKADVTFHYDGIPGIKDESTLKLYTRASDGESWKEVSDYTIDDEGDSSDGIGSITAKGLTEFSQFIIAGAPLTVRAGNDMDGLRGAVVTAKFYLRNLGDVPASFNIALSDTLGWELNPRTLSQTLKPNEEKEIAVAVSIPSSAASGTSDEVTFLVTSARYSDVKSSATLKVTARRVLINEVCPRGGWVEIFNPEPVKIPMAGCKLVDGDGQLNFTIPEDGKDWDGVLESGKYLVVHLIPGLAFDTPGEDIRARVGDVLDVAGDSVALLSPDGGGIDFMRYGDSTDEPPSGIGWQEDNPSAPERRQSLGRNKDSLDTDSGSDWESSGGVDARSPTPGLRNLGYLLGDVSMNGWVSAYDATLLLRYLVGKEELNDVQLVMADVTGRRGVTAFDAATILQYIVGLVKRFPAEEGSSPTPSRYGVERSVTVGNVEATEGGVVEVPVVVDETKGILSGSFAIRFDPDVLRLMKIEGPEGKGYYQLDYSEHDGKLQVAFAGTREVKLRGGRLLVLKFKVLGGKRWIEEAKIRIEDAMLNEEFVRRLRGGVIRLIPRRTALLQNYPNPFNPETWIPYQLSEDAEVEISIYDIAGRLVKRMDLGFRKAGYYVSRGRAIRWDGRNEQGERVASGIYIYRMQVGGKVFSKRMVILK